MTAAHEAVDEQSDYAEQLAADRRDAAALRKVRQILVDHFEVGHYKEYEDTYVDGWTDAVNSIALEIDSAMRAST